ncbi:MAG: TonB-dependent receptor [bacterium]|nr:MAG: TonB-dependent receptor [bacterium]
MRKCLIALLIIAVGYVTKNSAKEKPVDPDSIRYRFAPIVVTGQRYEMPQKDVAASISIISPIEIRQTNLTTVADAISYLTPGVFTTRRSAMGYGVAALAGGSITIRGIGGKPNTQVLMLIDGRPDFQGIFGHPINDAYFLDNVDHIEVLRGPASAVYGTNALGGVVNIITRELPTSRFDTQFNIGYGSYNTQRYRFHHAGNIGELQYFLGIGYQISDGHRENSNFEAQNYAVKIDYQISPHYKICFNSSVTPYQFHDPGPAGVSLSGYFDYGDITRSSMDLTLSNKFANTDGTIKFHGNFGKHKLSDGWDSDDQTNGLLAFQNFNLPYDIKTTVGFDVKRYGGTSQSNGNKLGTFFNDEYAVYFHIQKILLKKVIMGTGIRFEENSNYGQEWIPKFGLVYHPLSQTAVRATVAKGFRTPSIKDLFLFPPANKDLQPERLWNYEFGINQSYGKYFALDVCGFYYKGDQLIQTTMIAPGQMQNQNIGSNQAKGFELALQTNPITCFSTNLSYSYLASDEIIPFSPHKFNFMLNYKLNKLNVSLYGEHIRDLFASYQLNQIPLKTTIEKLSDYTLVHLKLNYQLLENLQLSAGIENLLDESYEILKGYPMPGRTVFSNLSFRF